MNKDIRPDKTSPAYLKKNNSGGLFRGFLYVLIVYEYFKSWLFGKIIFPSPLVLKITSSEDRLAIIEEQMNIADEINNDSLTDISSSIQFLDKEIRKLWDLSNKRNKVNISKLTASNNDLEKSINDINQLLSEYKKNIDANTSFIEEGSASLSELKTMQIKLKSIRNSINAFG